MTSLVLSEGGLVTNHAGAGLRSVDNKKLQSLVCDPLPRNVSMPA